MLIKFCVAAFEADCAFTISEYTLDVDLSDRSPIAQNSYGYYY